eukprot:UC1_evm1s27
MANFFFRAPHLHRPRDGLSTCVTAYVRAIARVWCVVFVILALLASPPFTLGGLQKAKHDFSYDGNAALVLAAATSTPTPTPTEIIGSCTAADNNANDCATTTTARHAANSGIVPRPLLDVVEKRAARARDAFSASYITTGDHDNNKGGDGGGSSNSNAVIDAYAAEFANWQLISSEEAGDVCGEELRSTGLCAVPGFLTAAGLEALRDELTLTEPALSDKHHTVFQTPHNDSLPADHVRNRKVHARIGFVGRQMLPGDGTNASVLEAVYSHSALRSWVSRAAGEPIFLSSDNDGSVYGTVNNAGYCTAWHFDQHPYSAAVVLHKPASGGAFEWVHNARQGGQLALESRIGALLDGVRDNVRQRLPRAGTLVLFRGESTLHQVAEVHSGTRVSAVFAFARRAGFTNSALTKEQNKWSRDNA